MRGFAKIRCILNLIRVYFFVFYNTAAYFRIRFSRSMNDLSLAACWRLYFVCKRINESAGTSNAASNIIAVLVVSGRRPFNNSFNVLYEIPICLASLRCEIFRYSISSLSTSPGWVGEYPNTNLAIL